MPAELGNYRSFDENSPSAILRVAVAVAFADDEFDHEEYRRVELVYRDVCIELGCDGDPIRLLAESKELTSGIADEVAAILNESVLDDYIEHCADEITELDLQELTILSALRVAGGDHKLAAAESSCLLKLCSHWDISLHDVIEPYLKYGPSPERWKRFVLD